jgi:hypothetical protein
MLDATAGCAPVVVAHERDHRASEDFLDAVDEFVAHRALEGLAHRQHKLAEVV